MCMVNLWGTDNGFACAVSGLGDLAGLTPGELEAQLASTTE